MLVYYSLIVYNVTTGHPRDAHPMSEVSGGGGGGGGNVVCLRQLLVLCIFAYSNELTAICICFRDCCDLFICLAVHVVNQTLDGCTVAAKVARRL